MQHRSGLQQLQDRGQNQVFAALPTMGFGSAVEPWDTALGSLSAQPRRAEQRSVASVNAASSRRETLARCSWARGRRRRPGTFSRGAKCAIGGLPLDHHEKWDQCEAAGKQQHHGLRGGQSSQPLHADALLARRRADEQPQPASLPQLQALTIPAARPPQQYASNRDLAAALSSGHPLVPC